MKSKVIEPNSQFTFKINPEDNNVRLDVFLSKQFSYSRSFFQKLISDEGVLINNILIKKPSHQIKTEDEILVKFPAEKQKKDIKVIEKDLGIEVLFEHPDFLIIYKPAGILVHEVGSKKHEVTLVDWLLHKFKDLAQVGASERPGIVHRLDMLTCGIMIVPRNNFSHTLFGNMLKNRQIKKTYLAIVQGHPDKNGTIEYGILRHPSGYKMTYSKKYNANAREALTHYKVIKYLKDATLVEVHPITGRTHQIRVHFAAIGHPIIGDILYGNKSKLIDRQALHACCLEFEYEGQKYNFKKDMPEDMKNLIKNLEKK